MKLGKKGRSGNASTFIPNIYCARPCAIVAPPKYPARAPTPPPIKAPMPGTILPATAPYVAPSDVPPIPPINLARSSTLDAGEPGDIIS